MTIAIIADIHANAWALEAVLADIQKQHVDAILNLGDIVYGPLQPRRTWEMLEAAEIARTVRGNQDRQIYDGSLVHPTLDYTLRDLGKTPVPRLKCLPVTAIFDREILLCHGTPSSDETYLLEDVTSGFPVVRPDAEIIRLLSGVTQPVILCGHTHLPRVVRLSTGQLIVNPGSVGLLAYDDDSPMPHLMETFSPHASYAILAKTRWGWDVDLRRIAYNTTAAAECAAAAGRPDWSYRITSGRAARSQSAVE